MAPRASDDGHEDSHFRVVVRIRPPLDRELESPLWHHAVVVSEDHKVCLQELLPEKGADRASGASQVVNNHSFAFDHVYDRDSSQLEIYLGNAKAAVSSVFQGYNATILAYGPTGTGKTYSMEGARGHGQDAEERGIIPRSMEDVFRHIAECPDSWRRFSVRASYLQIYNEVISDLLKADRASLMIREDRNRGVFVDGLSEWLCRSPAEVQTLMERGSMGRATAQTGANDVSSRSHAVFIIVVEQSEVDPSPGRSESEEWLPIRLGRLNLVDLAGSERPRITGAKGQRLEETKKINQSLSAVGNVISALTERCPRQHIPYRDSKLTRLLEDSLGGNCLTTMMVMVSPASESFGETLSTLKFAHRAKAVRNNPRMNDGVDPRARLRRYEAEVHRLRAELQESQEVQRWQQQQLERAPPWTPPADDIASRSSHEGVGSQASVNDFDQDPISVAAEDRAQIARYRQLLLKQRDILIALTQRLQERDEMIGSLQDKLDSRDRQIAQLEHRISLASSFLPELKGLWWPEAAAADAGSAATSVGEAKSHVEDASSKRQYPPESSVLDMHDGQPMPLLSADEKIAELASMFHDQRQENHCLWLELEALQQQGRGTVKHEDGSDSARVVNSGDRDCSVSQIGTTWKPTVRTPSSRTTPSGRLFAVSGEGEEEDASKHLSLAAAARPWLRDLPLGLSAASPVRRLGAGPPLVPPPAVGGLRPAATPQTSFADALRAEAQQSVDALLARRREQLRTLTAARWPAA